MTDEGEVVTFYGTTDGTGTTGTFNLDSDVVDKTVVTTLTSIRPDKGMVCKIWARWMAGKACTVYVEQTEDVTVDSPTYKKIGAFHLSSEGELHEDERHPFELLSRDGKQAFRLTWEQTVAAVTHAAIKVEFTRD